MNFSHFVSKPNLSIKNEGETEEIHNTLKMSLIEDWDISFEAGVDEYGEDIAIDESTGDIYVVGYNGTVGVDYDVLLIKYNSDGDQQWNVTWDNGGNEYGYGVAVDSQSYVYVAGSNGTTYPTFDVLLLKFNSSGEQEWFRTWDSGDYDAGWGLKIDSQDNLYIAGQTKASQGDLLLLKYDSSGLYKWNSTFGGTNGQHGYDLAIDSSNNIYIAGLTITASQDLLLVKFNSSGFHVWNRTWGGTDHDYGWGVALDSGNSVYIAGWTQSFGALLKDMVVVKYDTAGNWQWNRTWGTSLNDEARSIGVDSADNVYMYGFTNMENVSIVKFNATGEFLWDKQWGNSTGLSKYWGYDLVIDSFDKIYITGYYRPAGVPSDDLFLVKLSIEVAPADFTLSSNAGTPDDDGDFTLTWTSSSGANNYSIYQYSSFITQINGSLTVLTNGINSLSLPLSGYSNGTYYFIAVAFNDIGSKSSNCISVAIAIPPTPQTTATTPNIPGFNLIIIALVIGIVSITIIRKKSKLK